MYYNDQIYYTIKYERYYKNNKREGKRIFIMDNSDRYEGEFQKDKISGKGKYIWNDEDNKKKIFLI